MRGTPTLNCTVSTAMPGRDTENTCSTPAISARTCSAGRVTSASTSRAEAPGNGTKTFAIVTLICGSSSRGVTATANRPSSKASSAASGVSCECWKIRAIRPEMPMAGSASSGRAGRAEHAGLDRLERDALAGPQAGEHLDGTLVAGGAEADLAHLRPCLRGALVLEHVDARHFAALEHGLA